MASMSVSGVISGMDWDSMIDEIITAAAKPAQVQVNKRSNLVNKKSLFEEMKVTMQSLQSTLSPLKLPSTYKAKELDIERIDTNGSYKGVLTASVNADAEVNVYDLKVNRLATAQTNRSKQITSSTIGGVLNDNGISSGTMYINMGGRKIGIDVSSTDSLQSLKSKINNTIKTLDNPLNVTASVVDNRLILKSDNTGLGTASNSESITYGASGYNRLETISVNDADLKAGNFVIRDSKSNKVNETNYVVVNGNEIRWKQYEDTDAEVKLGESVDAKYTMAQGDVYTVSASVGKDAELPFDVVDGGTLSKRLTIRGKDSDGNTQTYYYGTDFTLEDGKVVWLEKESTTYEPDSYTVSYSKDKSAHYSAEISKGTNTVTTTNEPESYIVRYDDKASGTFTFGTITGGTWHDKIADLDFEELSELYEKSTGSKLNLTAYTVGGRDIYYIDPDQPSMFDITIGGTEYKYGRDFVINTADETSDTSSGNFRVTWGKNASGGTGAIVTAYAEKKGWYSGNPATYYVPIAESYPASGTNIEFNVPYDYDYTLMGRVNASDNDKTLYAVFGTDIESPDYTKLTIRGYNNDGYGTDFLVNADGEIEWVEHTQTVPSEDEIIDETKFAELQADYNKAYGRDEDTALKTVTLTGSDGVIRTYIDPEDLSEFTIESGDNTYEYGRDFVIRVSDDGKTHSISWLVSSDADGDDLYTAKDANVAVSTYTQYKNISTLSFTPSPSEGSTYSLKFDKARIENSAKTVSASSTDKNLSSIMGVDVDPDDEDTTITITSTDGKTTYVEGEEYTIDSEGNITWKTSSTIPFAYNVNYTAVIAETEELTRGSEPSSIVVGGNDKDLYLNSGIGFTDYLAFNSSYKEITGEDIKLTAGFTDSTILPNHYRYYIDDTSNMVLTTDDGTTYNYGTDFIIRMDVSKSSGFDGDGNIKGNQTLTLSWSHNSDNGAINNFVRGYYNLSHGKSYAASIDASTTSTWKSPASGTNYSLSFQKEFSGSSLSVLPASAFSEENVGKIEITSTDGSTRYRYGKDYTIEDGELVWLIEEEKDPKHPVGDYTLQYEAYTASSDDTLAYDPDESTLTASLVLDEDGDTLTYSQVLADAGLSSTATDTSALKGMFTLTDEDGTAYTYGTDYTITTDDDDGIVITWAKTEYDNLFSGTGLTLTYNAGGPEVMEIDDAVTRSAVDEIRPNTTTVDRPLYSKFEGADEIRISDGKETFYLGTDFTISGSSASDVVINWLNDDLVEEADYINFDGAKSISIVVGDTTYTEGSSKDFTVVKDEATGKASIEWNITQPEDLTGAVVKVKTDNGNKAYTIDTDGTTLLQGALWYNQDSTSAGTYTVYLTKDGQTTKYGATRNAGSYELTVNPTLDTPKYSDFSSGTSTITQGLKTFYEGIDYDIINDGTGSAQVEWRTEKGVSEGLYDAAYEWYMPNPGSTYTINLTTSDGETKTYTAGRTSRATLNMADLGFTTANGNISVSYNGGLGYDPELVEYKKDDDGEDTTEVDFTGNDILKSTYSFNVMRGTQGGTDTVFNFYWLPPTRTANEDLPAYGDALTVEYEYDANTFSLTDDQDGALLKALELGDDFTDKEHYTAAQDAELELDGEIVTRSSNYIGESYGNELIKGMTMQLKGVGEVSLDVSHNAQKAVESINSFMETYNDLMSWMNTRMTESQVDEDTAATIDSDDFRMRWGLLHGNSLLRQTKSKMRDILAQSFTFSFTQRSSTTELYGTMAHNGLKGDATLRLRIGSVYSDLTISPTMTVQDIADMINDSTNPAMRNMFYGDDGKLLAQPRVKASVQEDKLVISSTSDEAITMSGTAAMNALKMNYTYKGLFQLGLATTSTDHGKSGELEFDESKFMEALEDNPDEVQELMLMFAGEMDTWVKSMLTSSASGETSGTLTRQIEDLDTQIASIDEYLEKYQDRLDRQEETLRSRYAAAEEQFYKLSQQANSIAAILNQLNGYTNSSSDS